MKKLSLFSCLLYILVFPDHLFSQNIGIGTNSPNAKAILDVKATDRGMLFPRMTTAQRNAISSPPDGLHVFNTDERCLNYYDSVRQVWNCYCFDCQTAIINITSSTCKLDFYNSYARDNPAKRYVINIAAGVTINGCGAGDTALSFSLIPFNASVIINNNGTIAGGGGKGGNGARTTSDFICVNLIVVPGDGQIGGAAISTKPGVSITVNNYGLIAGGGGGGGGGGPNPPTASGGGGGGGAGMAIGTGGNAGGVYPTSTVCTYNSNGTTAGQPGTATIGGTGGNGGAAANPGGNGGNRAQPGTPGLNSFGGPAGKAISGGSGNLLNNLTGGQSFGAVD